MHDINFIRDNPIIFDNFMKQRGELPCAKNIIKIDEDKRNTQTVLQNLFFAAHMVYRPWFAPISIKINLWGIDEILSQ